MSNQQDEKYPYMYDNSEEVIYQGVIPLLEASDIELQYMLDKMAIEYKEKIESSYWSFLDHVYQLIDLEDFDVSDDLKLPEDKIEEFENLLSFIMLRTIAFNHDVFLLANHSSEELNIDTTLNYQSLHNNEIFSTLRKKIMRGLEVI